MLRLCRRSISPAAMDSPGDPGNNRAMLAALVDLTATEFAVLAFLVCLAGIVRGFSGFALSAMVMATAVLLLPPVALIPVCWWLEVAASILMVRGGLADADKVTVLGLFGGSVIGVPLGLWATTTLPLETSKLIALALVVTLAALQLGKFTIPGLATRPGLYGAGVAAGLATGLAGIGGMVVALYVLAQDAPARVMRASLVIFLFLGSITSLVTFLLFGVMDATAVARGVLLAGPALIGVWIGQHLFRPSLEGYYRPFCLALLITLASAGLIRLGI